MARKKKDNTNDPAATRNTIISLNKNSVFDWGSTKDASSVSTDGAGDLAHLAEGGGGTIGPSRYDPTVMSRIVDITDLVDDSSDDDENESAIVGHSTSIGGLQISAGRRLSRSNSNSGHHRSGGFNLHSFGSLALVTILIIGSALLIGNTIMNNNQPSIQSSALVATSDGEELLMTAERIVLACSDHALTTDRSECQNLCNGRMCCFETDDYSCDNDDSKDCPVYAGCKALLEGVVVDGAEEEDA